MCGIVGIVGTTPVNQALYDALTVLQHRGQDAAGIVTIDSGNFRQRKANGLVKDVFEVRHMQRLKGHIGIGHVRYPTAGSSSAAEAQPFYVNSPYGMVLAHNGNLTNAKELKEQQFKVARRHINTTSDSEVLLNVLAHELDLCDKMALRPEDIFSAVRKVHQQIRGAYAVVSLVIGHGLIGFRDPNGIRPLILGRRVDEQGRWSTCSPPRAWHLTPSVSRRCATSRRGGHLHHRAGPALLRAVCGEPADELLHLRIRLLRPP